jgi:hypothetical protein
MTHCTLVRFFYWVGLFLSLLGATACSGSFYTWTMRTSSTPFPASFQSASLGQHAIALLTPLSLPALRGTELGISQYLGQIISQVAPTWKVVGEQETVNLINRHGLTEEYARMCAGAEQSHILGREPLRKIGHALGVRYVFQPRLIALSQTMTDRWTFPVAGVLFTQTRSSTVRLAVQLWDIETGELIWGSLAETNLQGEAVSQDPVFVEDAVRVTLGGIMADFLNRKTSSKYTPLNQFLNDLMKEAIPEEDRQPTKKP